jgi:hypothetical protein
LSLLSRTSGTGTSPRKYVSPYSLKVTPFRFRSSSWAIGEPFSLFVIEVEVR